MNCSTVAGAPAFSNYYKKRTIPGFTKKVSVGCTAHFARHDPTKSSRRQEAEDCACLRLLQAPKTKSKSTSYQSYFIHLPPRKLGHFVNLSFLFVRSETHIHAYTYTYTYTYTCTRRKQIASRLFALLHITTPQFPTIECRDMHVTPNMRSNSEIRASSCEKVRELSVLVAANSSERSETYASELFAFFPLLAQHMYSPYMSVQCDRSVTSMLA